MMNKVIIIAEAGVNHNGSVQLACQLIDAAKEAGADYVKFQTFIPGLLVSKEAKQAEYQQKNSGEASQHDMLKELALTYDQFQLLFDYCKERNIGFLSTGFDEKSVKFIDSLGVDYHKVPSGEITNFPYLKFIGSLKKKVILSTGMSTMQEVKEAFDILTDAGTKPGDIVVLQCTTEYPAPFDEVNLLAMRTMAETLKVQTGFSDHTQGIEIPVAAVALGATVIEKHFTLDREMPGPDHRASLEPGELASMVRAIRNVEVSLGDGVKRPAPSEVKNIKAARRSIHTAKALSSGHIIMEEDLVMKRPGHGISPMLVKEITGKRLTKDLPEDWMLNESDFS